MLEYYGANNTSYLKSDFCQLSHHTCESFTAEGYDAIAGLVSTNTSSKNSATIWFAPCSWVRWQENSSSRNKAVHNRLKNKIGATPDNGKIILRNGTGATSANPNNNTQSLGG